MYFEHEYIIHHPKAQGNPLGRCIYALTIHSRRKVCYNDHMRKGIVAKKEAMKQAKSKELRRILAIKDNVDKRRKDNFYGTTNK